MTGPRARRPVRRPRKEAPAPVATAPAPGDTISRELSWLDFNARVLAEALRADNPLLERLNFLSIVSSNLDEFYMVRVGGLARQARAGVTRRTHAGMTPAEQLRVIARRAHAMVDQQMRCLSHEVLPRLAAENIARVRPDAMDRRDRALIGRRFAEEIFPTLTPVAADDDQSFPEVPGLVLHLAVRLRPTEGDARGRPRLALVPMPAVWPRFLDLPARRGHRYILLEDVIRDNLPALFPGHDIIEASAFRVTRDADLPVDDEEDDLMESMESILRARRAGAPVRLEIETHASKELGKLLCRVFDLDDETGVFRLAGPLDLKPFMKLASRIGDRELHYPRFEPQPVAAFEEAATPWDAVRRRDVLLHLPYESFSPVVSLIEEAADDPDVLAIKQTLYRTSPGSPIVAALERAALAGKQVTALVELKARFDEAQNMNWARRLADAGVQVIYGVMRLKTHAKLLLIVRREADGIRRYVHISTGNYNEATATRYEDVGLLTCDPDLGADAANFFNAVTGYSVPQSWRQLVVAPIALRERLRQLIERETARASRSDPGLITLKMNTLIDAEMAELLYRASQQNVRIRLCVRGACCLRPGVKNWSENITVISIVDRFLEHSRIFHFRNGGDDEVYLSSADFMPRNLDRRLELMCPVRDEEHRRRLLHILDVVMSDNQRAWRLRPDGTYEQVPRRKNEPARRAQSIFMDEALARASDLRARKLTVFRPRGPGAAPWTTRR